MSGSRPTSTVSHTVPENDEGAASDVSRCAPSDAPSRNRTENLLIKSQARASDTAGSRPCFGLPSGDAGIGSGASVPRNLTRSDRKAAASPVVGFETNSASYKYWSDEREFSPFAPNGELTLGCLACDARKPRPETVPEPSFSPASPARLTGDAQGGCP